MDWSFPFWSIVVGTVVTALVTYFTIRVSVREARRATRAALDAQRRSELGDLLSELIGIVRHEGNRRARKRRSPGTSARWNVAVGRLWFSGAEGATVVGTWLRQLDAAWLAGDSTTVQLLLGNERRTLADVPAQIEKNLQTWFAVPDYADEFEAHTIPEPYYSCPD